MLKFVEAVAKPHFRDSVRYLLHGNRPLFGS